MEATDVRVKLVDRVRKFDTVMMVTEGAGTLHGRPMAVAEVDDGGEVWFVTDQGSTKTDEARTDHRALVTGQSDRLFVSLKGQVDVVNDVQKIRALWREAWRAWFPKGKDDPSLVLLRFKPEEGEYWDERGTSAEPRSGRPPLAKGVRFLFEAAKELISGERHHQPTSAEQHAHAHEKVRL